MASSIRQDELAFWQMASYIRQDELAIWKMASYIRQDELAFGRWLATFGKMSWPFGKWLVQLRLSSPYLCMRGIPAFGRLRQCAVTPYATQMPTAHTYSTLLLPRCFWGSCRVE